MSNTISTKEKVPYIYKDEVRYKNSITMDQQNEYVEILTSSEKIIVTASLEYYLRNKALYEMQHYFNKYTPGKKTFVLDLKELMNKKMHLPQPVMTFTRNQFDSVYSAVMNMVQDCNTAKLEVTELDNGRLMFTDDFENIKRIKHRLSALRWNVYIGKPGTGKSENTVCQILSNRYKNILVISLSNLVGSSLRNRIHRRAFITRTKLNVTYMSYTKVAYNLDKIAAYDCVVFEESSMLSSNELCMVAKVLQNFNGRVIFNGDTNQLPAFLGHGSLLYSLCRTYKEHVTTLTKNYRFDAATEQDIDTLLATGLFAKTVTVKEFKEQLDKAVDRYQFANAKLICFKNETVGMFNRAIAEAIFNVPVPTMSPNDWKQNKQAAEKFFKDCLDTKKSVPVTVKQQTYIDPRTGKECDFKAEHKCMLLRNEEGVLKKLDDHLYKFIPNDDDYQPVIIDESVIFDFDFSYACTIHKAQGLEWDYVFYFDDAGMNSTINLSYVGISRSRKQTLVCSFRTTPATDQNKLYENMFELVNDRRSYEGIR